MFLLCHPELYPHGYWHFPFKFLMTNEMRKKYLLFALCVLGSNASAQPTSATPVGLVQATFVGEHVNLVNDNGQCSFVRPGQVPLRLDMAWPCRFAEDRQKKVRVELFRGAEILMVERSEPLPAPSNECVAARQVIRHFRDKLEIAPVLNSSRCGLGFWDQKNFVWQFDW